MNAPVRPTEPPSGAEPMQGQHGAGSWSSPARPPNRARMIFHVVAAGFCLWLTLGVCTPTQLPWVAAAFAGTAWFLEAIRRIWPSINDRLMRMFAAVAHPSERRRVNSSTWFMTALVPLAATGSPLLCAVGVTILGVGDPAAALVGRRFGRRKLRDDRTLEGSAAFVVVGALAAFGGMQLVPAPPPVTVAVAVAVVAAVAGAIVELLSRRVDDNLSIPLIAAAAAALTLLAFGLPPGG